MKNLKSCLLLFLFPLFGWAQSLNGVYTGVLSNDSTTIRKDQSFEMALTEYKGKVYGYAYSTFIVNDTLYFIVKRVKGTVTGDICEVKDDEVISHNFPKKPEKGVFVTYTLRRNKIDNTWTLDGNWKTNATKKYYALTGKVDAKEEKDLSKSKLYQHLGDLNLQQTLAFNKPAEKNENKIVKTKPDDKDIAKNNLNEDKENEITDPDKNVEAGLNKNTTKVPGTKINSVAANSNSITNEKKDVAAVGSQPVDNKSQQTVVQNDIKTPEQKTNSTTVNNQPKQDETKNVYITDIKVYDNKTQPVAVINDTKLPGSKTNGIAINNQPIQNEVKKVPANETKTVNNKTQPVAVINDTKSPDTKTNSIASNNQPKSNEIKNISVAADTKPVDNKTQQIATNNDTKTNSVTTVNQTQSDKKTEPEYEFTELHRTNRSLKPATKMVKGRESKPEETIAFKSDSLVLALYDNGEVDGDTVSVIINDEVFVDKQGLKSSAFKKTFYYSPDLGDSLLVVLFADNLGKYPPNTGLLIIKDGDNQHYVRFSADFNRNAAILLRKEY